MTLSLDTGSDRFIERLNGAVRENPVAAGLVGLGVFWMLFGSRAATIGSRIPDAAKSAAAVMGGAARSTGGALNAGMSSVGESVSSAARSLSDKVESVTGTIADAAIEAEHKAGSAASDAKAIATNRAHDFVDSSTQTFSSLQKALGKKLEEQPLLLGALGLAVGVSIATALPVTEAEQDLMGTEAGQAKHKLQSLAGEARDAVANRAKAVFSEIRSEAAAQGLTAADAKTSLDDVAIRVRNVAGSAKDFVP